MEDYTYLQRVLQAGIDATNCAGDGINPTASGAGLVLVHNYHNPPNKPKPAVLFFRSVGRRERVSACGNVQIYELPGGGCDSTKDQPAKTAERELREETSNFLSIPDKLIKTGIIQTVGSYRTYLLRLDDSNERIKSHIHAHNVATINLNNAKHKNVPPPWLEMDMMARVYVEDIVSSGVASRPSGCNVPQLVRNTKGELIMIYPRDASVLKKHLADLTNFNTIPKVVIKGLKTFKEADAKRYHARWLEGTKQYYT